MKEKNKKIYWVFVWVFVSGLFLGITISYKVLKDCIKNARKYLDDKEIEMSK